MDTEDESFENKLNILTNPTFLSFAIWFYYWFLDELDTLGHILSVVTKRNGLEDGFVELLAHMGLDLYLRVDVRNYL